MPACASGWSTTSGHWRSKSEFEKYCACFQLPKRVLHLEFPRESSQSQCEELPNERNGRRLRRRPADAWQGEQEQLPSGLQTSSVDRGSLRDIFGLNIEEASCELITIIIVMDNQSSSLFLSKEEGYHLHCALQPQPLSRVLLQQFWVNESLLLMTPDMASLRPLQDNGAIIGSAFKMSCSVSKGKSPESISAKLTPKLKVSLALQAAPKIAYGAEYRDIGEWFLRFACRKQAYLRSTNLTTGIVKLSDSAIYSASSKEAGHIFPTAMPIAFRNARIYIICLMMPAIIWLEMPGRFRYLERAPPLSLSRATKKKSEVSFSSTRRAIEGCSHILSTSTWHLIEALYFSS